MKYLILAILAAIFFMIISVKFKKLTYVLSIIAMLVLLASNRQGIMAYFDDLRGGGVVDTITISDIDEIRLKRNDSYNIYDNNGNIYFCYGRLDYTFYHNISKKSIPANVQIRYLPSSKEVLQLKYEGKSVLDKPWAYEDICIMIIILVVIGLGYLLFKAISEEWFFNRYEN